MAWILVPLGVMIALVVLPWVIGAYLPEENRTRRRLEWSADPARLFELTEALVRDEGWSGIAGRAQVLTQSPPELLELEVRDDDLPRFVRLRIELVPQGGGCVVEATRTCVIHAGSWRTSYLRVFERLGGGGAARLDQALARLSATLDSASIGAAGSP